jgi:hypothetical protein
MRNKPKRWDEAMLDCDRCGLKFARGEMRRQRGLLLDKDCYDDLINERGG